MPGTVLGAAGAVLSRQNKAPKFLELLLQWKRWAVQRGWNNYAISGIVGLMERHKEGCGQEAGDI